MKITIDELLNNSYVLTSSREGLNKFDNYFLSCGFNKLPKPFFGRYVPRDSREFMYNRHWLAAHMSHFEICRNAQLNNLPFVCIFEEDILASKNILEKLSKYLENIPDDAFILRMGYVAFRGIEHHRHDSQLIECVDQQHYYNHDYSGSHAYIIFNKFYDINNSMLECYNNVLINYKDNREIHNWKHYTNEQLKSMFFYEWMMNPFVYRNEIQKHVYSVNTEDCLFTQREYIYNMNDAIKYFYGV